MQKSLRFVLLFLIILTAGFWTSLQFDAVQKWAISRASHYLKSETGALLTVGSLRGAPPFLLGAENVELTHPDIGHIVIDSIDVIPSWIEIIFGRISFLWVTASGVDLRELLIKNDTRSAKAPLVSCAIHSLHIDNIAVPKAYFDPLLTNYSDQSSAECLYSLHGSLSWKPSSKKLALHANLTPYAGDVTPGTLDIRLVANSDTTDVTCSVDALKVGDGSVFIALPCDRLSVETSLKAKTSHLLKTISGTLEKSDTSLFTGTWNVQGLKKLETKSTFNPIIRFNVGGSFEATDKSNFSFATTDLSCEKIELLQNYKSKKDRLNQELALANPEDLQDPSTLSRITAIATPKSIQGSLKVEDSKLTATLATSSLTIGNQTIPSCTLSGLAEKKPYGYTGSLKADMSILYNKKEVPLAFSTDFTSDAFQKCDFENIIVSLADHRIAGALKLNLFPLTVTGALKSQKPDAHTLGSIFNATIGGLQVKASFAEDDVTHQKMDILVAANDVKSARISCKKAELFIYSTGLFSDPTMHTILQAVNFENRAVLLDTMRFETLFNPEEKAHPYSIHIRGQTSISPCRLDCSGVYGTDFFKLEHLEALSGGHVIKNTSPVHAVHDREGYHLYPFEFTSDSNMLVHGNALISDNKVFADIAYNNFPLESLDPFLGDITLFGNISGRLEASGKKRDPQVMMKVATSALYLWNPSKIQAAPLSASCQLSVEHGIMHVESEVEGMSTNKPASFECTAPLTITKNSIGFSDTTKLTGRLSAEFDSNTLLSSYLDEDEIMEGIVAVDAKLGGVASNPAITGQVTWKNGKLFIPLLGTLFSDVQMIGHLQDNKLLVEELTATDSHNGTFVATGWIKKLFSKKFHYQIDGTSKEFATIALDDSSVTASGKLSCSGDKSQATFTGTFDVQDAALTLSPNLSRDVPKIDITYIGKTSDGQVVHKKPFLFNLNLDLTMNKGIVRGMGLESTWKGKAQIIGQNKKIDINGKIQLANGTLNFAGKTFALTQGSLEFHGDLYKKSLLHVIAANEIGNINTQVVLQGPLESPRVVIQSNPAMTQKEILSWLLFNKSSSDISPIQGIQLGQQLLKLKGNGSSIDVIEEIKQKLHIDRLDFGSTTTARPQMNPGNPAQEAAQETVPNEVSVQVGKYISDGVIVILSKDVTNEVNRVGVEANLSKHITAQANVGDDAQTELSLEWKIRY
ncbi:MAG: translocation/assembly module TamB [Chlamydiales bacterium]|nr:translocation/assembly module TamB [Chlamydiales bacterium]